MPAGVSSSSEGKPEAAKAQAAIGAPISNSTGRNVPDGGTARTVAVLEALALRDRGGVGVRELAAELGLSRASVHRILRTLSDLRVARALPLGRYEVGPRMAAWASKLAGRHSLLAAARDVIARLGEAVDETVYLLGYTHPDDEAVLVYARESTKALRYIEPIGTRIPLHAGASGRSMLAFVEPSVLNRLRLTKYTDQTHSDIPSLAASLEEVRHMGYAVSYGERIVDARGIAAPVFQDGQIAGAISLTIPVTRFDVNLVPHLGALVTDAARELSSLMSERAYVRPRSQPATLR